jgi:dihydrolipoamide dehydrogenase
VTIRVVVLGAGPGGYVAAIRAAQLGARVTVIEPDNVGGTCLNWGCIPSKVLITTAELIEKMRRAAEYGLVVDGGVRVDLKRLMARKQAVIAAQTKGILGLFQHHKITWLKGEGTLAGPGAARVRTAGGETTEVAWDRLIIAAGTRPLELPGIPFDGEQVISSNEALGLEELPGAVLIVGGGVIGCEFACLLSSLGSRVTLVEALSRLLPLPAVDEDCAKVFQRELKKRKIDFRVDRVVEGIERRGGRLEARIGPSPFAGGLTEEDKTPIGLAVDKILVCVGRKPNSDRIGLETLGLKADARGWIDADETLQTGVEGVFAIGDILGPAKVMLAHVASMEGLTAAENAVCGAGRRRMNYDVVPGAIFTSPEVACVGLSERQARERGIPVRADRVLFRNLGKAQVLGEIAGEAKLVSRAEDGRLLGVHLIGAHATELLGEATLALQMGARVEDLARTIHAHPTLSEIMLEAALKADGRALHGG